MGGSVFVFVFLCFGLLACVLLLVLGLCVACFGRWGMSVWVVLGWCRFWGLGYIESKDDTRFIQSAEH